MKLTDEEFKQMAERISLVSFEHSPSCNNDDCVLSGAPGDCDGVVMDDTLALFQACYERCPFGVRVLNTGEAIRIEAWGHGGEAVTAPTFEAAVREFARRLSK